MMSERVTTLEAPLSQASGIYPVAVCKASSRMSTHGYGTIYSFGGMLLRDFSIMPLRICAIAQWAIRISDDPQQSTSRQVYIDKF